MRARLQRLRAEVANDREAFEARLVELRTLDLASPAALALPQHLAADLDQLDLFLKRIADQAE